MHGEYTAVIEEHGDWWIGWIEEIPGVNCQERSREELMETLEITLREALEPDAVQGASKGTMGRSVAGQQGTEDASGA